MPHISLNNNLVVKFQIHLSNDFSSKDAFLRPSINLDIIISLIIFLVDIISDSGVWWDLDTISQKELLQIGGGISIILLKEKNSLSSIFLKLSRCGVCYCGATLEKYIVVKLLSNSS